MNSFISSLISVRILIRCISVFLYLLNSRLAASQVSIIGSGMLNNNNCTGANFTDGIFTSIFDSLYPCSFATTPNCVRNLNISSVKCPTSSKRRSETEINALSIAFGPFSISLYKLSKIRSLRVPT